MTARPRKPLPPVTSTRRSLQKSGMARQPTAAARPATLRETPPPMRVAVTLEQCWHRVPGGTADVDPRPRRRPRRPRRRRGPRRRRPPRRGRRRARSGRRCPCATSALPRRLLYEAWHTPVARWPPVQRATGPVDVVHGTAVAVPPAARRAAGHDRPRPRVPRRPRRRSPATASGSSAGAPRLARRHADAGRGAVGGDGRGVPRRRVRPRPAPGRAVGPRGRARRARRRSPTSGARHGLPERYGLFVGTLEPRKNLPRLVEAWRATGPTCRSCWPARRVGRRRHRRTGGRSPSATSTGRRPRRPLRRGGRRRLPEPARGLRPAGARGHGPGRARA